MGLGGEIHPHGIWIGLTVAIICAFVATATLHDRVLSRREIANGRKRINEEGLARIERRWPDLPALEAVSGITDRSICRDLDLTGSASLLRLAGTAETPAGKQLLASWLLGEPDLAAAKERQEAVKELLPAVDFRQELQRRARSAAIPPEEADLLVRWSRSEGWYRKKKGLRVLVALLGAGTLGSVIGAIGFAWSPALPFFLALANVMLTLLYRLDLHASFAVSERGEAVAEHLLPVFSEVAAARFESSLLKANSERTRGESGPLSGLLPLERLLHAAGLRATGPFYWVAQSLTLWDFHLLAALESWRERHGSKVERWLRDAGEFEALSALSTLAFENPDWCFPDLLKSAPSTLVARDLGHPLLPSGKRVANDFELGPGGSFVLLTGSNMSGKSTFLRTVGINALLAQAGGPVCAAVFQMVPVTVSTSLQIEDSLADGVSYFLAELGRLKEIVDTAARLSERSGPRALFLLDEMLRGTNSQDRKALAEATLKFLMEKHAVGIVSTHDSALADIPVLSSVRTDLHFQETIREEGGETRMSFDYKLRPGVATTSNAQRLAEAIGLLAPRPLPSR
jgi:hypothetical protein